MNYLNLLVLFLRYSSFILFVTFYFILQYS